MEGISAFVAHSFRPVDEDHVRKFLGFLDHMSEISDFSWDHALVAKPQDLREKVLEKIEGKNLLIAICSRHSYSVPSDRLKKLWFGSKCISDQSVVEWVASEWIVQEIGLAIGRGMSLILLVEDGVRTPGGMQGNIEYISYSRDAPEKSFTRMMEMIHSLLPKKNGLPGESAAPGRTQETESADGGEIPDPSRPLDEPNDSMSLLELQNGWFLSILDKNLVMAERYKSAFKASPAGSSELERARWDVREQWLKSLTGDKGSLEVVREIRKKFPSDSDMLLNEGRLLSSLEEYSAAAQAFLAAADGESEARAKAAHLGKAIGALIQAGDSKRLDDVMRQMREIVRSLGDDDSLNNFIRVFRSAHNGQKLAEIAALEALLETNPSDQSMRFDLAYLYSQEDMNAMALYHYMRIPNEDRAASSWNNIGVALNELKITGKSVSAYSSASSLGSTLAVGNIAFLQRNAGFYDDAERACRNALIDPDCEPRVAEALASITEKRESEEERITKLRGFSRPVSEAMRRVARAYAAPESTKMLGKFVVGECSCELTIRENQVLLEGSYERERSALRQLSGFSSDAPTKEIVAVRFEGDRFGNAVFGTFSRKPAGSSISTILASSGKDDRFCMHYDEKLDRLEIVEFSKGTDSDGRVSVAPRG